MSSLLFFASDSPLEEIRNPHYKLLSVNEALAIGMEVHDFLLAPDFDRDKPGVILWTDTNSNVITIDLETNEASITDDGFDDDFALLPLHVRDANLCTDKPYRVYLEWQYSEGRAQRVIDYLRSHLQTAEQVELWHVWLTGSDPSPRVRYSTVSIDNLTPEALNELEQTPVWEEPPVDYCLTVTRKFPAKETSPSVL